MGLGRDKSKPDVELPHGDLALRRDGLARIQIGPRLVVQEPGYTYHAWVTNAMGGFPDCIDPGMFLAGKTIAATLLDLFTKPEELGKAQAEFNQRTGGGNRRLSVGGSSASEGLQASSGPALARIHRDRTRPGMVDTDPCLIIA